MTTSAASKLLNYFTGLMRSDIIAHYVKNPIETDKKQWIYRPRKAPLSQVDIDRHLNSEQPIGLYVLPGELGEKGLTRVAIVDLDDKEQKLPWVTLCQEGARITRELDKVGLLSWPCRSGSGHGVHLWLRWSEPQPIVSVRAVLVQAVKAAGVTCHVDLFPSGESLRMLDDGKGGKELEKGTLVALPLSRKSRPISDLEKGEVVEDLSAWMVSEPPMSRPVQAAAPTKKSDDKAANVWGPVDVDTLNEALRYIDNTDYEIWRDVGIALKQAISNGQLDELDAENAWNDWAAGAGQEKFDERGQRYQWTRFRPNGKLTIGTIWFMAEKGGWKPVLRGTTKKPTRPIEDSEERWNSEETPDHIRRMNQDHFLAMEGGKTTVYRESWDARRGRHLLERMGPGDFKLFYANQKVVVSTNKKGVPQIEDLGKVWLESEFRRQYKGLVLAPGESPVGVYNMWRGFTVEPSDNGSCDLYLAHVKNNICGGDELVYDYLLKWMALSVQRPGEPAGVAIVMRGGRGTGKGTFARELGRLFGQHYNQVFDTKHLTGHFNRHLQDCVLLFADEAVWAGSKQEEGILKALITEETLFIEGKGRDAVQCENHLHLLIATNNEWSVPAGMDERRFLALHVGDDKKQDEAYFRAIRQELVTGRGKLLKTLLDMDLTNYSPYSVPNTKELAQQKVLSMDIFGAWWFDKLVAGQVLASLDNWTDSVPIFALYLDLVQYCQRSRRPGPVSVNSLGHRLKKLIPGNTNISRGVMSHDLLAGNEMIPANSKQTFYELPSLEDCRKFFEDHARQVIDWEEPTGVLKKVRVGKGEQDEIKY